MVWKKRLQLNGAWHVSPILLVWPQRKGLSEASPPSLSVPWSYSKDVFVGKDKLPSEQMRTLNRSSSLFGKVIYQPKMCRLTDKPIKGREILEFMRVEESHTKSVLLTTFIYSDFWFYFSCIIHMHCRVNGTLHIHTHSHSKLFTSFWLQHNEIESTRRAHTSAKAINIFCSLYFIK